MKLAVSTDGFRSKRGFGSKSIKWNDVREIEGAALSKATYDENFLIFATTSGALDVGELDKGFDTLERALLNKFPDFPADWRLRVEAAGHNARVTLWRRFAT